MKVCDFRRQILTSGRLISTAFQLLREVFNLLEGGSKRFHLRVPGKTSGRCYSPDQAVFAPTRRLNGVISSKR